MASTDPHKGVGYETSDANGVLDGNLDDAIKAYLKTTVGA